MKIPWWRPAPLRHSEPAAQTGSGARETTAGTRFDENRPSPMICGNTNMAHKHRCPRRKNPMQKLEAKSLYEGYGTRQKTVSAALAMCQSDSGGNHLEALSPTRQIAPA